MLSMISRAGAKSEEAREAKGRLSSLAALAEAEAKGATKQLYVAGGMDSHFRPLDSVVRLDWSTRAWEVLPPLSVARGGAAAVVVEGRLYILGGEVNGRALREAECYDPVAGTWEILPPMNVGRVKPAVAVCDGYIYLMGGLDDSKPMRSAERFNTKTRIWEVLPCMHRARYASVASSTSGRVHIFAGELTDDGLAASSEIFDPQVGEWALRPAVRNPLCGAALVLAPQGTEAFALGGLGLSGQALGVAEHIPLGDLANMMDCGKDEKPKNLWTSLPPMPTARHQTSATNFLGGAVVVGGKGSTFEATASVEYFNPTKWAWEALPPLPGPRVRAAVAGGC